MSNIYDKAYELARMVEGNENYIKLRELSEKIRANKEYLAMIENFQKKQFDLYQKKESGNELAEEEYKSLSEEYEELMAIGDIKALFETEHQLSLLINDIYRILNAPLAALNPQEETSEENK